MFILYIADDVKYVKAQVEAVHYIMKILINDINVGLYF